MKKLLIVLLLLVLVLAAVGFFAPKEYAISRSIVVQAPPEHVHVYVGDLRRWPEWTPWQDSDPTIKTTYGAQTSGAGATQSWTGEDGAGELTLTRWDPSQGIAYGMAFIMEGSRVPASGEIRYAKAAGGGTEITWTMQGSWKGAVPPVLDGWMKILSPWMIGAEFDKGLAKLKRAVEV